MIKFSQIYNDKRVKLTHSVEYYIVVIYRHGYKLKSRLQTRVVRGFSIVMPLFVMSSVTAFSLGSETAQAPNDTLSKVQGSFFARGSQPQTSDENPESEKEDPDKMEDKDKVTESKSTIESTITPERLTCRVKSSRKSAFESSISPEIRKLSEYEDICGGSFIDGGMMFMGMPVNDSDAKSMANDTAIRLKEFSKFGLTPKIIMEPLTNGTPINFTAYANGNYDDVMRTFYNQLKSQGVTDIMMGELTPFPEANIPVWGEINPDLVARCITKTAQLQKATFPASKISVLLDSKSYPNGTSWSGGQYKSLLPYVSPIPKGLIDSFGLQGYPWPDPQPEHRPEIFLNAEYAVEAAQSLGASNVWFNTGTFKKGTAWNGSIHTLNPDERYDIITKIISQVGTVKSRGYSVEIMLFAENKFNTSEGNDWSYWTAGQQATDEHRRAFLATQNAIAERSIPLYIFDSY